MQSLSLSKACREYFLDKELASATVEQYRYFHNLLSEYMGSDPAFDEITTQQIRRFLKWLKHDKGLSPRTVAHAHTALSSLWQWAVEEYECEHIVKPISRPKFAEKIIEIFTEQQIRAILASAEYSNYERCGKVIRAKRPTSLRDKAIIITLLDTGLRASELCGLKIQDYDEETGRFSVFGKGSKPRVVYAGRRTQRAILRYLNSRKSERITDPLFAAGEFEDSHIERRNLLKLVRRIGNNAGVKNVHPHRFRHTFAVTFLRNKGGLEQLRLLMGHKNLRTVMVYAKLAEVDLVAAVAVSSPADNWKL